jgi:hypothetical protein
MVAIKQGSPHGLYMVYAQKVGSDGISYGVAGDTLAEGSTSEPLLLKYPKSATLPSPDRTVIDFQGGDRWIGSYQYGISTLGTFDFITQDANADFVALATGTNVDQTSNTELTEFTEDTLGNDFPTLSLVFVYRIQSSADATFGQNWYIHTVIPQCQIAPKGVQSAPSFQTAGEYAYQVTPTAAANKIHGPAFGTNLGATDNKLSHYHIISPYPLWTATHHAAGVSGTVVGSYQPFSTAVGSAGATKNEVQKDSSGTVTGGVFDTITQSSGTFAWGTALVSVQGDFLHLLYQTQFTASV